MSKNSVVLLMGAGLLVAVVALLARLDGSDERSTNPLTDASQAADAAELEHSLISPTPDPPNRKLGSPTRTELESTSDSQTARRATESSGNAAITGSVIDEFDAPVQDVLVLLLIGSEELQATTNERGQFSFEELKNGNYRLFVEPKSLPPDFIPPWRQQGAMEYTGTATGIFGTFLRVDEERIYSADLRVFRAATVSGRALEADGQPMVQRVVTMHGEDGRKQATRTDAEGSYKFERVYPGMYAAAVLPNRGDANSESNAPLPHRFEVTAGADHFLPDFVATQDGYLMTGSVVDFDGVPMVGILVRCLEIDSKHSLIRFEATTDGEGRFRIGRMPAGDYFLILDELVGRKYQGIPRIKAPTKPREISTVGEASEFDVGELRVESLHPFSVQGRLEVSADWAQANTPRQWTASLHVRDGEVEADYGQFASYRYPDPRQSPGMAAPRLPALGTFHWGCATPYKPVELVVVLDGGDGQQFEQVFAVEPVPDGTLELRVVFD